MGKRKVKTYLCAQDAALNILDTITEHAGNDCDFTVPIMFGSNVKRGEDVSTIYFSKEDGAIIIE